MGLIRTVDEICVRAGFSFFSDLQLSAVTELWQATTTTKCPYFYFTRPKSYSRFCDVIVGIGSVVVQDLKRLGQERETPSGLHRRCRCRLRRRQRPTPSQKHETLIRQNRTVTPARWGPASSWRAVIRS